MTDVDLQQHVRTVWWEEDEQHGVVCIIDQALLALETVYLKLDHEQQVADAIKTLKVRGAPVIGVTAAFGIALAINRLLREYNALSEEEMLQRAYDHVHAVAVMLSSTRPTAVNLFWAIDRMLRCANVAVKQLLSLHLMAQMLYEEAQPIAEEDVAACLQMGKYGAELIADGDILLTHCNAGALATAGLGTALAPMYIAHQSGKHIHIYVDETRPVLQGARLTAWELQQEGIPLPLITDNMPGHFSHTRGIKAVFVGADRIAPNGDIANKICTYSVAVLAHTHNIPFYVVAPQSTIDPNLPLRA